jgi:hypothetical protein
LDEGFLQRVFLGPESSGKLARRPVTKISQTKIDVYYSLLSIVEMAGAD